MKKKKKKELTILLKYYKFSNVDNTILSSSVLKSKLYFILSMNICTFNPTKYLFIININILL